MALTDVLRQHNPVVRELRRLSVENGMPNASLILKDSGADEIAAIMSYSNISSSQLHLRHIVITHDDGATQHVSAVSRLWEPLVYSLLFPHGTLGWGLYSDDNGNTGEVQPDVAMSQMWHYRMRLLLEHRFRIFGRLTNEYIVDMFSRFLETRLQYIRTNQLRIRREDAELMGQPSVPDTENVYLPSSFLSSQRWASEQVADALTIAAHFGSPTFFVTMTCNPFWPEIQQRLLPGQRWGDDPVLVSRVFKQKFSALLKVLKSMFSHAGPMVRICRAQNMTYISHSALQCVQHRISETWLASCTYSRQVSP